MGGSQVDEMDSEKWRVGGWEGERGSILGEGVV